MSANLTPTMRALLDFYAARGAGECPVAPRFVPRTRASLISRGLIVEAPRNALGVRLTRKGRELTASDRQPWRRPRRVDGSRIAKRAARRALALAA